MKAAQSALGGTRKVVLDKRIVDAQFGKFCAVIRLRKKTPLVPEYFGSQFQDARKGCFESLQKGSILMKIIAASIQDNSGPSVRLRISSRNQRIRFGSGLSDGVERRIAFLIIFFVIGAIGAAAHTRQPFRILLIPLDRLPQAFVRAK